MYLINELLKGYLLTKRSAPKNTYLLHTTEIPIHTIITIAIIVKIPPANSIVPSIVSSMEPAKKNINNVPIFRLS